MNENVLLEIKSIYKSYGNIEVLKNISFKLISGEVLVILGPSGCGKSTLLRCINGLEEIQSGEIIFKGENLISKNTNWSKIRTKIGMVFQNYELFFHLNILENIILAPMRVQKISRSICEERAKNLLNRFGLGGREYALPKELSGGQKQRVAIIRALMMEPEILLFDEVTASLDPEVVREVLDVILELAKEGKTMIIVTHEMGFAKAVGDRVLFLEHGDVIEHSDVKEFFNHPKSDRAKSFLQSFEFKKI